MAENNQTPTQSDIETLEAFNKALVDQKQTLEDILQLRIDGQKIEEALAETFGKQVEFLTQAEKRQAIEAAAVEKTAERVKEATDLLKEKERLEKDLALAQTDAQKELLNFQIAKLEAKLTEKKIDEGKLTSLKNQLAELKKIFKTTSEAADLNKASRDVFKNQIEQITGVKETAGSVTDIIAKSVVEGRGFGGALEAAGLAAKEVLTPVALAQRAMDALKAGAKKLSEDFKALAFGVDSTLTRLRETDITFTRETGQLQSFGQEVENLQGEFIDFNFTTAETNQAFRGLTDNFQNFTNLTVKQRSELTRQAATLERFGVSTSTLAGAFRNLNQGSGQSASQIIKTTTELSKFGRALGIGPNKMLEDLNQNFDIIARHGGKRGIEIFKGLAVFAKQAGVEMQNLLTVGEKFNTFEGAMETAGKLNFILGGPLLNSMELLNATEEERIELLRQGMEQSGKTFSELERFEKEAFAATLGVGEDVAEKIFNDKNITSIKEATAAIENQAKGLGDLGKEAAENTKRQELATLADEKAIEANKALTEAINKVGRFFDKLKIILAPLAFALGALVTTLGLVFTAFKTLAIIKGAITLFKGLTAASAASSAALGTQGLLGGMKAFIAKVPAFVGASKAAAAAQATAGGGVTAAAGGIGVLGSLGIAAAAAGGVFIGDKINEALYGEEGYDYDIMSAFANGGPITQGRTFNPNVNQAIVVGEREPEMIAGGNMVGSNVINQEAFVALAQSITALEKVLTEDNKKAEFTINIGNERLDRRTVELARGQVRQTLSFDGTGGG